MQPNKLSVIFDSEGNKGTRSREPISCWPFTCGAHGSSNQQLTYVLGIIARFQSPDYLPLQLHTTAPAAV
jgi:hypothetical protein